LFFVIGIFCGHQTIVHLLHWLRLLKNASHRRYQTTSKSQSGWKTSKIIIEIFYLSKGTKKLTLNWIQFIVRKLGGKFRIKFLLWKFIRLFYWRNLLSFIRTYFRWNLTLSFNNRICSRLLIRYLMSRYFAT
jgi:hypothetical protein